MLRNALMSGCDIELFEKKTCDYLPRCEPKRYGGSFLPFEVDQMSGFSTPWLERGLESDSQLSYAYDGSSKVPNYDSNAPVTNYGGPNNRQSN